MARVYSLEGNIGSGKSTLLNRLSIEGVTLVQEPVDMWEHIKDKEGETILSKFYRDQKTYAFPFQMMAYISRLSLLKKHIESNPTGIFLTERSVHTDKCVFAQMLYDAGKIEDINFQIYLRWFDEFIKDIPTSGFVYLRTSPDQCYERVVRRNRPGEQLSLAYLVNCHQYHDDWLSGCVNVLTVDGNTRDNDESYERIMDDIGIFVNSRCSLGIKAVA
jgi:deoxyadenosine/deoxycytidine kinase